MRAEPARWLACQCRPGCLHRAEPGSSASSALTLSRPWPVNGALSLRSLFSLTWGRRGWVVRERGVTQKSRPCLKRPIVFPNVEPGVWNLRFRGGEGVCVRVRPGQGVEGTSEWHLPLVAENSGYFSYRHSCPPCAPCRGKTGTPGVQTEGLLGRNILNSPFP